MRRFSKQLLKKQQETLQFQAENEQNDESNQKQEDVVQLENGLSVKGEKPLLNLLQEVELGDK